jgi:hypothetical protein
MVLDLEGVLDQAPLEHGAPVMLRLAEVNYRRRADRERNWRWWILSRNRGDRQRQKKQKKQQ